MSTKTKGRVIRCLALALLLAMLVSASIMTSSFGMHTNWQRFWLGAAALMCCVIGVAALSALNAKWQ
ncbi:MAG: hypothetical protein COT81_04475 [Candidatus Buchananbacteria bacterium CG10_big_fil_rev_8_21_14_0_10_42_9]|uniref:Uncharacterized protein n=1 Tax=Candidatus Buchananbacteria bacterium CG10_big_fil_rev_8_21_14_0_10_42_9 TaxID=1974526 RepID=A0A2H0W098_9BACT|nr:MAG: hypothetical protein COT81_04475 [Candidatus Buchananbacteria bacterium CG10_big_fil_rev_8_21_14_0_10_42_9]